MDDEGVVVTGSSGSGRITGLGVVRTAWLIGSTTDDEDEGGDEVVGGTTDIAQDGCEV